MAANATTNRSTPQKCVHGVVSGQAVMPDYPKNDTYKPVLFNESDKQILNRQ